MSTHSSIAQRVRRTAGRIATLGTVLLALPSASHAQSMQPLTGRVSGALHFQVSEPRGDFGKNTGNGFGVGGTLIWHIDPQSVVNWRADAGFLTYGSSSRTVPLSGTGGLIRLNLRTSNNIFTLVTGPQLQAPAGPITPYVAALGGFSVFWTESSVEGTQNTNTPFANTTNNNDGSFAYGGAAGTTIRLNNGPRRISLDLGARFLRHDDVKYLNDERVRDAFVNNRDPIPLRGRADFVTYYLGVSAVLF